MNLITRVFQFQMINPVPNFFHFKNNEPEVVLIVIKSSTCSTSTLSLWRRHPTVLVMGLDQGFVRRLQIVISENWLLDRERCLLSF